MSGPSFVINAVLVAATLMAAQSMRETAQAQLGCCMTRQTLDSPWVQIDADFDECKRLDDTEEDDDDDILKREGTYWWNIRC